ncbi:MAG: sigma-70 family RNA polymerase sigma factor [Pirellulaceae bacterium]|jgi:RNA polymerase sigma-70 factor (ECF subfamily)
MMAKVPRKDPESGAQLTDEELVVEYRTDGDREVFALLVRRYERELYSYLRRYLGSAEMAEDVFQATFLQVHLKCDRFDENRRFRPWLYTVATNQAIDAQRRNKRHRMVSLDRPVSADNVDIGALVDLLEGDERDPLENVSQLERGQWVQEALDGLSESMRSVVHLVYYQGMKYREAAEILDIPVGTVKSRLHAAIIKLYDSWDSPEV